MSGSEAFNAMAENEVTDPEAGVSDVPPAPARVPGMGGAMGLRVRKAGGAPKFTWFDKVEAFVSRLSTRDNFWHSICSFIWLPLAFFSGIKMKAIDANTFTAVLPFRKFNRNWYNAMAGGALLANSEIAGGMYVFGIAGSDYTVVCRELAYKFLRPCLGPAVYRITPREDIQGLIATGREFNITVEMEISQQGFRTGEHDKRVGRCEATFHVTPKVHHKVKRARRGK